MTERRLYELLSRNIPEGHWQRLETLTGAGWPDVNVGFRKGHEVWVELKEVRLPKRATTPVMVPWRPSQLAWWQRRIRLGHGDRLWLALAVGDTYLLLFHGQQATMLSKPHTVEQLIGLAYAVVRLDKTHWDLVYLALSLPLEKQF